MAAKGDRRVSNRLIDDILACGPDFILDHSFSVVARVAKHLGVSTSSVRQHIPSESELIRHLCLRHLNEVFDAVLLPTDWCGTPIAILRAMALALLVYADEKQHRHRVFLLYRQGLSDPARGANEALLTYLTNNFQLAWQDVFPEQDFDSLHSHAQIFLGQLLHLPLWWPAEPHVTKDEWLCHVIGCLAQSAPPDWRMPAASRLQIADTLTHWGNRQDADPPSHVTA